MSGLLGAGELLQQVPPVQEKELDARTNMVKQLVKLGAFALAGANAGVRAGFNPLGGAVVGLLTEGQFNTSYAGTPAGSIALGVSSAALGLSSLDFSPLLKWVEDKLSYGPPPTKTKESIPMAPPGWGAGSFDVYVQPELQNLPPAPVGPSWRPIREVK